MVQLLLLMAVVLSIVILLARLGGITLAMQYGQSALNGNDTFYFVVDVQRGLRLRQDQPLDTTLPTNRETAADGRRVVSAQRGGVILTCSSSVPMACGSRSPISAIFHPPVPNVMPAAPTCIRRGRPIVSGSRLSRRMSMDGWIYTRYAPAALTCIN